MVDGKGASMKNVSAFVRRLAPVGVASLMVTGLLAGCVSHPPRDDYVVFFDTDSVTLSPTGEEIVASAVGAANRRHISQITVSGSAGKNEDPDVLKKLADARAENVVDVLVKDGIKREDIRKEAFVPTAVEDSRVALRRVTIHLGSH
ncbi:OmpA family protein [Bombella sp. TMW 2.2559]|uniref:OmpA family protein n=1 Tax=Bombella dulcis TaxID=2967339 RepID=A0ABT3WFT4_9PROT|nr:OmpA family protein [Bombella dulcis]MCX5615746.1 OmpA family protein [Bombella dulcis]